MTVTLEMNNMGCSVSGEGRSYKVDIISRIFQTVELAAKSRPVFQIKRKSLFSFGYTYHLRKDKAIVGSVRYKSGRASVVLDMDGKKYSLYREDGKGYIEFDGDKVLIANYENKKISLTRKSSLYVNDDEIGDVYITLYIISELHKCNPYS